MDRWKRQRAAEKIQNSSLPSVPDFIAIIAALSKCFHVPVVTASPDDDKLVRRMKKLLTQSNMLQERLVEDDLLKHRVWQEIDTDNLSQPFPRLSLDDIRTLTFGI